MKKKYFMIGLALTLCCSLLLGINTYTADDEAANEYGADDATYTYTAPDGTIMVYHLDEYGEPYIYDEDGEKLYTYMAPDGTVVEYYLDENGYPYLYEDGERLCAMIPLERNRVTDQDVIDALNGNGNLTDLYSNGIKNPRSCGLQR